LAKEKFALKDVYAVQRGKHIDIFLTISFKGKKTLTELDKIRDSLQDELEISIPNSDIDII
jgi:divalent metal cation (Fe/Co/Zn/Cd) transporter